MEETEEITNGETSVGRGGGEANCLLSATWMAFAVSSYGVSVTLLVFLMFEYNIKSSIAIQICSLIYGCVFMVVIAGLAADYSFFDSPIITIFSFISLLGMVVLTQVHAPPETPSKYQFGLLLVCIALGLLGFIAVINPYGFMRRDQFDKPPTFSRVSGKDVSKDVFVVSIVTLICYVEEKLGWGLGFAICCLVNAMGLVLFLYGMFSFRTTIRISSKNYRVRVDKLFSCEDEDEVKYLIKFIPLFLTDIFLQASDNMFNFLITLQALTMNRHIGPDFRMPASCFGFFSVPTEFLLLAIIDFVIASRCKKLKISLGVGLTHVLTILTLVASALIESRRLDQLTNNSSSMSALWLMVPEAVSGFKYGFHSRGHRRMYCRKWPVEGITDVVMRKFSLAMGYFVSIIIIQLFVQFTGWLPHNINDGRLDYVYWMLAAMGCLNFAFHLIFTKSFEFPTFKFQAGNDEAS